MEYELIFRIIEIVFQLILVIFAGIALFAWKREIRGRDKYRLAQALLEYIKEVRFIIYSKNGSLCQIYLNDILVDKNNFYNNQLSLIEKDKVYFDQSVWGLFSHINTRSNIFLPKQIRILLDELYPYSGKHIGSDKNLYTYIHLSGVITPQIKNLEKNKDQDPEDGIYEIYETKNLTIKDYFTKWEKLLIELQKFV